MSQSPILADGLIEMIGMCVAPASFVCLFVVTSVLLSDYRTKSSTRCEELLVQEYLKRN